MRTWCLGATTALLLVSACSSYPARRRVKRPPSANVTASVENKDASKHTCTTVLDCIRAQGSPPTGMKWTCDVGVCESADVGSRPIASQ